jgi:hypothetical protein
LSGFDDGNQSQIRDDALEFALAGALPTTTLEGEGLLTQSWPEFDLMDIDLDGYDWGAGLDMHTDLSS